MQHRFPERRDADQTNRKIGPDRALTRLRSATEKRGLLDQGLTRRAWRSRRSNSAFHDHNTEKPRLARPRLLE